jgi:TolA-binding protein
MSARVLENLLLTALVGIASFMASSMREMSVSITKLNEQMATIIERTSQHSSTLQQHETRIRVLENTVGGK